MLLFAGIVSCTNYLCYVNHNSAPSTVHQSKEIVVDSVSTTVNTDVQ